MLARLPRCTKLGLSALCRRSMAAHASEGPKKPCPEGYELLEEGSARVIWPKEGEAFYNSVQVVNRDLSVLVYNLYADQLRVEAEEQAARRAANVHWRNVPPTWEHWGASQDVAALGAAAAAATAAEPLPEQPGLHVLEALAATGLRSVRYAQEVTDGVGIGRIVVNDLEATAVEAIKRNVAFNDLDPSVVVAHCGDAAALMYRHRAADARKGATRALRAAAHAAAADAASQASSSLPFDAVDIDPYGSPAPFLDAAVQSVGEGGLLAVTATDLAVLCGNHQEVCFAKYGSVALKARYAHEMALRIVLGSIETHANRYNRYIVPLVSLQIDFYLRVFVRVYTSKAEVKRAGLKRSYVLQSKGCSSFHLQPLAEENKPNKFTPAALSPEIGARCPTSGAKWSMGGPIWSAPIFNPSFVRSAIDRLGRGAEHDREGAFDPRRFKHAQRVKGLLVAASEELRDVPLYYSLPTLCKALHCTCPPLPQIQAALLNAGYRVSQSHVDPDGIKTDAPNEVMWDIMRAWVQKHPIKGSAKRKARQERHAKTVAASSSEGGEGEPQARSVFASVGERILSVPPSIEVSFEQPPELRRRLAKKRESKGKVRRWAPNPEENWGPKRRAEGSHRLQTHRRHPTKKPKKG